MECCDPGHSLLSDWEPIEDEAMTRRIAGIARVLRERNVKDDSYPHLAEQIPDLKSLSGIAEPYLLSKVESLFTDLTRNRSGDLHHGNILSDGDGWKVIDPHGYVGDPAAEIAVMIYNPLGKLPVGRDLAGFMDRRLHILAEETGDDLVRIRAWCFCKTMLSAAWNAGDFRRQAERELALAAVLQ
jgi:streptomycin 6-kinase